jgi:hypothetical protein
MIAKRIALGFGVAVVFPMLIHYGVSTFVSNPKWEDYQVHPTFDPYASPGERAEREAQQEMMQGAYRRGEKHFQQRLFAVAVPLGLVAMVVGAFLPLPALGTGLMFGGIFSICDGYFNYWSELADVLKFGSLLVAFALLLFLGYRRLERREAAAP